ncbi:hypothetical protein B0T17DRAFT_614150 [Bombardia bombarda]|uniref:BZIP domain-containing protein n=1 Tax=Bombardia bombarda TaxID=252184 RepID=A0AA39X770_9PEZI|nr:hypothetical protein B0T17DRAFT_614150 [Bombardia bombarda]
METDAHPWHYDANLKASHNSDCGTDVDVSLLVPGVYDPGPFSIGQFDPGIFDPSLPNPDAAPVALVQYPVAPGGSHGFLHQKPVFCFHPIQHLAQQQLAKSYPLLDTVFQAPYTPRSDLYGTQLLETMGPSPLWVTSPSEASSSSLTSASDGLSVESLATPPTDGLDSPWSQDPSSCLPGRGQGDANSSWMTIPHHASVSLPDLVSPASRQPPPLVPNNTLSPECSSMLYLPILPRQPTANPPPPLPVKSPSPARKPSLPAACEQPDGTGATTPRPRPLKRVRSREKSSDPDQTEKNRAYHRGFGQRIRNREKEERELRECAVAMLEEKNAELINEKDELLKEKLGLFDKLSQHALNCNDGAIINYLACASHRITNDAKSMFEAKMRNSKKDDSSPFAILARHGSLVNNKFKS